MAISPVPISGPTPGPFDDIGRRIAALPPVVTFGRLGLRIPFDRCGPPSSATLLTFDELPFLTEVSDDYAAQGVTFSGGGVLVTQPTDDDVGTESAPAALSNVAVEGVRLPDRFDDLFGDAPLAWLPVDGDIAARFAEPVTEVGVFVGLPTGAAELLAVAPVRGTDAPQVTATLTLFDGSGAVIGTDSGLLGPEPQPVRTCLYVQQPAGGTADVYAARISYDPPVNETIDSFWFRRNLPLPEVAPRGTIRITSPRAGALVESVGIPVAGEIISSVPPTDVYIGWICRQDPPRDHGVRIDGVMYSRGSDYRPELLPDPGDPLRTIFVGTVPYVGSTYCGLRYPLTLRAIALLTGTAEPRIEDQVEIEVYHERAISDAGDVGIRAVEVTQGIRSRLVDDPEATADPMIHVADRPTVVRVYPDWGRGRMLPGTRLYAELRAYRDSSWALPGSPLLPETQVIVEGETPTEAEQRSDTGLTFNFRLPASWTDEGTTRLEVRVFPRGVSPPAFYACTGCTRPVYRRLQANFAQGGEIDLYFHRVTLVRDDDGNGTDQRAPTFAEFGNVLQQLYQYLPIGSDGVNIRAVRSVTWAGPIEADTDGDGDQEDVFQNAMKRTYLTPAGITRPDPSHRGTMYGFYFGDTGVSCGGSGLLDQAYFHSGACAAWASTPTHEALHTLGLEHASNAHGEASGGGFDATYPGRCGQISYDGAGAPATRTWGTDVYAVPIRAIAPDVNLTADSDEGDDCAGQHVHDLLSYGSGTDWISPYTWNNVLERTGASVPVPVPGLAMGPAGGGSQGSATRQTALLAATWPADASAHATDEPLPSEAQLAITVDLAGGVTAGGALLVTLPPADLGSGEVEVEAFDGAGLSVAVRRSAIPMNEFGDSGEVIVLLPPDGWTELVIRRDGREVVRSSRSPSDPQVRLAAPAAGTHWEGDLEVRIEASDADGNALLATFEVSGDGGTTWQPIHATSIGGAATSFTVPRDLTTAGAGDILVRAQVTDGLRVAVTEARRLTIGTLPPVPVILEPTGEDLVGLDSVIDLRGEGWINDGTPLPDAQLEWVLDGDVIGHGRRWVAGPLEAGNHTLELRATNGDQVESTSVELTAAADEDGDGVADDWEQAHGLDAADASDGVSDTDRDGLSARDEYRWRTDPQQQDSDGDGFGDGIEVMTGGDPLDPARGPVGAHAMQGFPPTVQPTDFLPWILAASLAAAAFAALGAWWLLRRNHCGSAVVTRRRPPASRN